LLRFSIRDEGILSPTSRLKVRPRVQLGKLKLPQLRTRVFAPTITAASSTSACTGHAELNEAEVNRVAAILPDQQEIQRRRDLVRALFNDFWSVPHEKPKAFVDRLNQAETYINERLTVCGECWQLDTKTRVMLALPPRSN